MRQRLRGLDLPPPRVLVYVLSVFAAFLLAEGYLLLRHGFSLPPPGLSWLDLLFWAGLVFWSVRVEIRLPLNASVSHLFLFALALVALAPPWLAPLWVFLFQPSDNVWYKQLFNRSQDALATLAAALVWGFFQANPLLLGTLDLSAGMGIGLATMALFFVNTSLVSLAIHLASGTPLREVWRKNFGWLTVSYLFLSPIALLLARAYETPLLGGWGGWTVLFFLIPLPPFRIFNAYPLDKPKEKGALGELWKNTRRPLPSYPCPWRNWSPCSRHGSKPACQKGRENPAGPGPSPTSASFSSTWSAPSWASPANACAGNWPATLGSASASV
ncbi:hypothetical protein [Thermus sp. NEB1569]|uniref:hypothetical protein n=1 Tax=Thermus sp. NEB1569 TaxID=2918899 RepID=UPI00351E3B30